MTNQNENSAGGTVIEQQKDAILVNGVKSSEPHELGDAEAVLTSDGKQSIDLIKGSDIEVLEDAQADGIISNNVDVDGTLDVPTNAPNKGMQQTVQSNFKTNTSPESEKEMGTEDELIQQNALTLEAPSSKKEAQKKRSEASESQNVPDDNHSPLIVEIEGSGSDEGVNNNNNSQGKVSEGNSELPGKSEGAAAAAGTTTSLSSSSPEVPADKPVLCLRLIISSGSTAEFTVNPEWTVREITAQVHANWPTHWAEEQREGGGVPQVSDPSILRLIYQGRFLHSSMTLKALNLQEGHTVVMHLVPRESLPESNLNENDERPVVWDYHVIAIMSTAEASRSSIHQTSQNTSSNEKLVFDFDTKLNFPCSLSEYISKAIRDDKLIKEEFRRLFRVIPAEEYLAEFASDRSHMKTTSKDGSVKWMAPPPNYEPIKSEKSSNNISEFWDMENSTFGSVLNFEQLVNFCCNDVN